MAKIQYSAIIGDVRGKLSGSQFSKNRVGSFLGNKPNRKSTATAKQSAYRANYAYLAKYWNGISVADKEANQAAAANYPYVDKFGNTRYFSGYQLLLRSNINRLMSGLGPISVVQNMPPEAPDFTVNSISISVVSGVSSLTLIDMTSDPTPNTDYGYQLFVGVPVGNGVAVYSGKYTYFYQNVLQTRTEDFNQSYIKGSEYWQAGQRIFIKTVVIHLASGVEVLSFINTAIVT